MEISDFSIKELTTIINGDCGFTPYLSGPQLVKLFNKARIRDVYSFEDGGTSREITTKKLC